LRLEFVLVEVGVNAFEDLELILIVLVYLLSEGGGEGGRIDLEINCFIRIKNKLGRREPSLYELRNLIINSFL
jgi:hypothetical protein